MCERYGPGLPSRPGARGRPAAVSGPLELADQQARPARKPVLAGPARWLKV